MTLDDLIPLLKEGIQVSLSYISIPTSTSIRVELTDWKGTTTVRWIEVEALRDGAVDLWRWKLNEMLDDLEQPRSLLKT